MCIAYVYNGHWSEIWVWYKDHVGWGRKELVKGGSS